MVLMRILANNADVNDFCFLGLVAEGEKAQKQTGGLVVTKDLMGNIQNTHNVL